MKKLVLYTAYILVAASTLIASQTPAPSEPSKETHSFELKVTDYRIKRNHIANAALSANLSLDSIQMKYDILARHPKLGALDGKFKGMDKNTILIAECSCCLPPSPNMLTGATEQLKEVLDMYNSFGIDAKIDNIQHNLQGEVESLTFTIKTGSRLPLTPPSETTITFKENEEEFFVRLVQKDPTGQLCVFDGHEPEAMEFIEKLMRQDPEAMALVKSLVDSAGAFITGDLQYSEKLT